MSGRDTYNTILLARRGWVSRFPANKAVVMIMSGGLDSIVTTARLLEEGLHIYPLHIRRGQRNGSAEQQAVEFFSEYFSKRHPGRFHPLAVVSVSIPPTEFKAGLVEYSRTKGYPLRDPILQSFAVQYAVAASSRDCASIRTVLCAIVPEDFMPHSNLETLRALTITVCQATNDWEWLVSSPNVDPGLFPEPFGKAKEVLWAHKRSLPVHLTVSCNDATPENGLRHCGLCGACRRRREAFRQASVEDRTEYQAENPA